MRDGVEVDTSQYYDFFMKTRDADRITHEGLREEINLVGGNVRDAVRLAALAIPAKGGEANSTFKRGRKRGLRQGIAAATETKIISRKKSGFALRVRVSGTKFNKATGKPPKLPRYVEGLGRRFKDWRHPVYGNYENWVTQEQHPFLLPTALLYKEETERAVWFAFQRALRRSGFR